jgi:hypothetical protein
MPRPAPRNLVLDTLYGRTRGAIVDAVHSLDDAVSRLGRSHARVLFEAASPLSLAVFRPVLNYLAADPRIEFWFTSSDGSWDAARIFGAAGISERVISTARARWMKFDAYVNADFWNMTWLPRRTRRVHLFHGVAGKYGLDAPVRIAPVIATFDRLLFPNSDRLLRYAAAGLVDRHGPRAALIGYPKVDCLVDGSLNRQAIQEELGLDPNRPTVLYAPTWSPYSSLNAMGDDLIAALARLDVNVIVKLHDRSLDSTLRGSGGIDWGHKLDALCRAPNVHAASGADISPYLFVADVLVTDHSSAGFEFMLMDRPIVVVDCPQLIQHARISPSKVSLLRSAADVVAVASEVAAAVTRALAQPFLLSERRRAIAATLFYGAGGATARAATAIYELLELAPYRPDAARVELDRNMLSGRSPTNMRLNQSAQGGDAAESGNF